MIAKIWLTLGMIVCLLSSICGAAEPDTSRGLDVERLHEGDVKDLDEILAKRRVIRVAVPYSRTLYFVDAARERGLVAEAMREFEREINKKLNTGKHPVVVVMLPMTRDKLLPAVSEGRADIAAGNITITQQRESLVAFSNPLYESRELIFTGPAAPPLTTLDDLAGQQVAVKRGSSYFDSVQALSSRLAQQGKRPVVLKIMPEDLQTEDLLDMVDAGILPMTVVDEPVGKVWGPLLKNSALRADLVLREEGKIAWALNKQAPKLLALVNEFLSSAAKQGLIESKVRSYISKGKKLKNNTASKELKRFTEILALFRKYGDRYHFDPLMLAAQGYQESGLNQNARSHVGAVGVMQIMPETGKELRVGDISVTEPNIHAGAKYMDKLMTKYFADAPFDDQNRALFAFASYNAGPGRVAKMRKIAEKEGLNPNVWFDNVELVLAKKVGVEPVQYVRNIYKYYVAYQLEAERAQKREQAIDQVKDQVVPAK